MGFVFTIIKFLIFAIIAGIAIAVVITVPLFIYSLPYCLWLGWNEGSNGVPAKCNSDKLSGFKWFFHQASNATKLYRSWITKKPHGITKF